MAGKGKYVLIVTSDGYGKRTPVDDFTKRHRGGKGVGAARLDGSSKIAGAAIVGDSGDVVILTANGVGLRTDASEISVAGRGARGVRVISLEDGDRVVSVNA